MTPRLMFLNTLLALALALVTWRIWVNYQADRALHEAALQRGVTAAEVPVPAPADPAKPASPASFLDVAQKMLFARDRNPNVIIDVEPPPAPPPPPPIPPFPAAYGMIGIGGDVVVLLSDGGKQRGFRLGDNVGPFKLSAIKENELTLEWNGQSFTKTMEELKKLAPPPGATVTAAAKPARTAPTVSMAQNPGEATRRNVESQVTNEAYKKELEKVTGPAASGPAAPERACDPGDNSPSGTVQNGYRKVIVSSPFGRNCIWQLVP